MNTSFLVSSTGPVDSIDRTHREADQVTSLLSSLFDESDGLVHRAIKVEIDRRSLHSSDSHLVGTSRGEDAKGRCGGAGRTWTLHGVGCGRRSILTIELLYLIRTEKHQGRSVLAHKLIQRMVFHSMNSAQLLFEQTRSLRRGKWSGKAAYYADIALARVLGLSAHGLLLAGPGSEGQREQPSS